MSSSVQNYRTLYKVSAITATPAVIIQNDVSSPRKGGHFVIDVTAGTTLSLTPTIDAFDDLSQKWYNLLTGTAITAVGTSVLRVYPGFTPSANVTASDFITPTWRFVMTHGNANAATYTVSARLFD